jgi:hypothetical protein
MRRKLTPAFVRDIEGGDTNQIYWDVEQRGFGLLGPVYIHRVHRPKT